MSQFFYITVSVNYLPFEQLYMQLFGLRLAYRKL